MTIDIGAAGGSLLGVLLLIGLTTGLVPGVVLRPLLRIFPRDDPRREELKAELYHVPFLERIPWLFQCIEILGSEGVPARWRYMCARWRVRKLRRALVKEALEAQARMHQFGYVTDQIEMNQMARAAYGHTWEWEAGENREELP